MNYLGGKKPMLSSLVAAGQNVCKMIPTFVSSWSCDLCSNEQIPSQTSLLKAVMFLADTVSVCLSVAAEQNYPPGSASHGVTL